MIIIINVQAKCHNDITPIHLAAKKGNCEAVEKLLELGANIYAKDF